MITHGLTAIHNGMKLYLREHVQDIFHRTKFADEFCERLSRELKIHTYSDLQSFVHYLEISKKSHIYESI